jgi:hypothetical protein
MGKALVLTVGGVLTALLNVLVAHKLKASIAWFTASLLDLAVRRLPEGQRERFAEEWASHLSDVSGDIGKIVFARGCVSAAHEMASFLNYRSPALNDALKRSRAFLKLLLKRPIDLLNAASGLLFGEDSMLAKGHLAPTIIVPTLLMGLAGYLISFAFPAKYTSQSVVLIEGQKVPESMVQPVISGDLSTRVNTLQQQVLAESKLRPVVQRVFPGKSPDEVGAMVDTIRANMSVEPVPSDLPSIGASTKEKRPDASPFPGFYVKYTAPSAREAQTICNELTTLLVDENSKQIAEAAAGTSEVLNRGIEKAKGNLEELGSRLQNRKKLRRTKSESPDPEDEVLAIDHDFAQKHYQSLLAKKAEAELTVIMNDSALGERMFPLNPADLPDAPQFPNRLLFAAGGLGAGLALGAPLALWTKLRSKGTQAETEPVNLP